MTLPYERKKAVLNAEQFLKDLMDPMKTPKVPKPVRERAMHLLRHYPNRLYMDAAARYAPEVFGPYGEKVSDE